MYDWANSAFYTTVVGALFSPYITRLAQDAVGKGGTVMNLGILGSVTAESFPRFVCRYPSDVRGSVPANPGFTGDYSDL